MSLYGPQDLSWHVFQEWVYLLGGPRALLMQLADPLVAAGVAEHSGHERDAFGRLHRTMEAMWAVAVGRPEQARAALESMEAAHVAVRGVSPSGVAYDARDSELRLWVFATLIDTVLILDRRYLRRFGPEERARYYQESRRLAGALGIPDRLTPRDVEEFSIYVEGQIPQLEVGDQARSLASSFLFPPWPAAGKLAYSPLRLITADLLPAPLRLAYRLRFDRRAAAPLRRSISLLRFLPRAIRELPLLDLAGTFHDRGGSPIGNVGAKEVAGR
ncbi:MAG: oxygenase MpaB family protein [Acidimicrobiia bacterium]